MLSDEQAINWPCGAGGALHEECAAKPTVRRIARIAVAPVLVIVFMVDLDAEAGSAWNGRYAPAEMAQRAAAVLRWTNAVSAAMPNASNRRACTCAERTLISSTPRLAALTRYRNFLRPAGVSTMRNTASATSCGFPAEAVRMAFILAGTWLAAPYVSLRAWSAAFTMLLKTGV